MFIYQLVPNLLYKKIMEGSKSISNSCLLKYTLIQNFLLIQIHECTN